MKHVLVALMQPRDSIIETITSYAKAHDWCLEFCGRSIPSGWYGDGVILDYQNSEELDSLRDPHKIPIVSRNLVPQENIRSVVGDTGEIARMVTSYFLERGYKNFAAIEAARYTNSMNVHPNLALAEELEKHGYELIQYYWEKHIPVEEHENYAAIIKALKMFFKRLEKPCAVFCPNVDYLHYICRACEETGIQIPHEVALLGNNEEPDITENTNPPTSAVFGEMDDVGQKMVRLLDCMMSGEDVPLELELVRPIGIISRQSTDILAVPDLSAATAINFLLSNYMKQISIKDAAEAAEISVSKMNQLFHRWVDHSPGEFLYRVRMDKIKELLMQSDYNLEEIAFRTGYGSSMAMSLAFKKETGITPGAYRKRQLT